MLFQMPRFLGFLLIACPSSCWGATEIEIGGPRHVRASIEKLSGGATCRIRFVPVSCFDQVTNNSINRAKSELYAYQALSKMVGVKPGQAVEASCRPLAAQEVRNGDWSISYQFEGIKVRDQPPAAPHGGSDGNGNGVPAPSAVAADAGPNGGDLLSCVDDMRGTIDSLTRVLNCQLERIAPGERLDETCVDLESNTSAAFARLSGAIQSQKMLLGTEKEGLLAELKKHKDDLLEKLRRKYNNLAPANEKP